MHLVGTCAMNLPGTRPGFGFAKRLQIGSATFTPARIFKLPEPEYPDAERFHLPQPQPQYRVGPVEPRTGEVIGGRISIPIKIPVPAIPKIDIYGGCGGGKEHSWGCNTGIHFNF